MISKPSRDKVIAYAFIALLIFAISRVFYSALCLFLIAPILVVLLIEKRSLTSIGCVFEKDRVGQYFRYAIFGFFSQVVVLAFVVASVRYVFREPYELSMPPNLLIEFIEQLYIVGLPEEIYYRGYLQTRLGDWLGETAGFLMSCIIFGIAHIISRVQYYGLSYMGPATVIGLGAFLGALVFGYTLVRTKSLYPSIVAHITTNMFASGIVSLVLGQS